MAHPTTLASTNRCMKTRNAVSNTHVFCQLQALAALEFFPLWSTPNTPEVRQHSAFCLARDQIAGSFQEGLGEGMAGRFNPQNNLSYALLASSPQSPMAYQATSSDRPVSSMP